MEALKGKDAVKRGMVSLITGALPEEMIEGLMLNDMTLQDKAVREGKLKIEATEARMVNQVQTEVEVELGETVVEGASDRVVMVNEEATLDEQRIVKLIAEVVNEVRVMEQVAGEIEIVIGGGNKLWTL